MSTTTWTDITPNVSARSADGRFAVRICHLNAGWRWLAYDHQADPRGGHFGDYASKEEAQAACDAAENAADIDPALYGLPQDSEIEARRVAAGADPRVAANHEHHTKPLPGCFRCILPVPELLAWLDSWEPRGERERAARRLRIKKTLRILGTPFTLRESQDERLLRALLLPDPVTARAIAILAGIEREARP